ncbi:hypothetical protein Poli38472_004131 [Pythium oligandrum]|uniref:H/ACA ribonucleoprotein complex non-core subunit NAF1 n=1 Tax=Pythium oligandrum TaxID=41045 RepID=A0A8K1CMI3_PYTOL|nr:hypothetical protein Poli38472_004131 [Pythium oligandrum]|eukprot:TMW66366.1 hypothetical protein Poli38472_004131 [Pythium oligandrum]
MDTKMDHEDVATAVKTELNAPASNGAAPPNGQPVVSNAGAVVVPSVSSMAVDQDDGMAEEDEESSEEESEEEGQVDDELPVHKAVRAGLPVSDIDVAAQYADLEIQSISTQFSSTVVDTSKPATSPAVPVANGAVKTATGGDMEEDDESEEDEELGGEMNDVASSDDDSSDEDEKEDRRRLRAEIEAAMEKEEKKASGPLKTVNEVSSLPVREPEVELTADCPIARCGTILNVSKPGQMVTIKSDMGAKPLDEGSVLCFEDRTVLGCVDEVFGPVLMPMYLVRFADESKIPMQTEVNKPVFYATQHTTYIVPESIRDKGTDASNIFDEEADETVYSDDEAEAAAKRQNRKRGRGDNAGSAPAHQQPAQGGGHFADYQPGQHQHRGPSEGRGGGRGHGRGRGRGGPGFQPQVQAQPHGGYTRYTTPGYTQPGMPAYPPHPPMPAAPYPGAHGAPHYPPPQQYPPPPHYQQPYLPQGQYYQQQGPPHGYAPPPPPSPGGYQYPPYHAGQPPMPQYGQPQMPPPPPPAPGQYDQGHRRY